MFSDTKIDLGQASQLVDKMEARFAHILPLVTPKLNWLGRGDGKKARVKRLILNWSLEMKQQPLPASSSKLSE